MKLIFRYSSMVSAVWVIAHGLYLGWQHLSPGNLQGHYDSLGAFMDYAVYSGIVAAVGVGFGVAGKTRLGIVGNLTYFAFVALVYFLD